MSATVLAQQVSDDQLSRYAKLIYKRTGIRISPQKKTLLSNRVRRRMRATGISCFSRYFEHLQKLHEDDVEWDAFLEEITTHETYLFRDPTQWDWFSKEFLPDIQAAARKGDRPKSLRIWSAACSTGDEAYTMACCIADRLTDSRQWKVEIVGTDIGVGTLEKAQQATFSERAMRLVPDSYRRRFFTQSKKEQWTAKPTLTCWTSFHQHNLIEPLQLPPFDLIVLKNVLIYFDAKSKQRVMGNLDAALCVGGMLLTGPAEGISDMLHQYERRQPWLRYKS